ncbi:sulfite exporter TauE/SafE family protein [Thalassospiraceae bacterium LMO-JJ14]|nr:sulfite exporter TauE/SafE family protein [Thalassospiraceae bacterium LMO-JJ14]
MESYEVIVLAGGLAGGLVNGLTGFGTGLTALTFWLYVVPPVVASPMVVICSVVGQLQTLPKIWHAISWKRVMPFIIGGLLGVPVGTWLLPSVPVQVFKIFIGVFLIGFCSFMLASGKTFKISFGGRTADGIIGMIGGVLGGIAGLSGAPTTIWASVRGWGKDEKRSIFQAFNLTILATAFFSQWAGGLITAEVGRMTLLALPGTLIGVWLGRRLYEKLDVKGFDRVVYIVLLLSGVTMIYFSL